MNFSKNKFFNIGKIIVNSFFITLIFVAVINIRAQESEIFNLKADAFQDKKSVELNKAGWKYHSGDDAAWATTQFDDSIWEKLEETTIKPDALPKSGWDGRGWFRLHLKVDENLVNQMLALTGTQSGATEVYLDGRKLAEFGLITDSKISEFNPNHLPIPFRFEKAGEHILAVRFASNTFADFNGSKARWLTNGGTYPGFAFELKEASDVAEVIIQYTFQYSMRIGFFFIGVLFALALLHFLIYIFYRADRANLFYSLYALALAFTIVCGNLRFAGHQSVMSNAVLRIISAVMLGAMFVSLLAFLRTAFEATLGRIFWIISGIWLISVILNAVYLGNLGVFYFLTNIAIFLSFSYSIFLVVKALRYKRPDAWILLTGVQIFAIGMFSTLVNQFSLLNLPDWIFALGEIALILAVPIAVSIFLARSVARTNRDLKTQLAQVETLSAEKIEQQRRNAELRAENERRAKELEEARQLQLSMLPTKLPNITGLEIAAYMKPATEVGGDYYDFYVGADGTLTVAVGDATGHGLKAGTVVTATKSLFNSLADAPDIPHTLSQMSRSLKAMNLRGLFMAMTLIKLKDKNLSICAAGMPSVIVYRAAANTVEEISIRALPLGGVTNFKYREQEISLQTGDCVVLMSDGFPEMSNPAGEMLGFDKAAEILPNIAANSPQEIINRFVEVSQKWAGARPADDDVTFVVLKFI